MVQQTDLIPAIPHSVPLWVIQNDPLGYREKIVELLLIFLCQKLIIPFTWIDSTCI